MFLCFCACVCLCWICLCWFWNVCLCVFVRSAYSDTLINDLNPVLHVLPTIELKKSRDIGMRKHEDFLFSERTVKNSRPRLKILAHDLMRCLDRSSKPITPFWIWRTKITRAHTLSHIRHCTRTPTHTWGPVKNNACYLIITALTLEWNTNT